eukprot:TRINITY_DN1192_c0_g1_i1.p1 TRINITY_DN1192_c0_g1~~TRINITY_DN1192_c0_g1_i1.p1  ORF type:complete len:694 (+),score=188.36 TRINITY_DN1192_c0_g1_i1:71-2152(+)
MYRQLKECRDQDIWWVERQHEILQQRIERVRSTIKVAPPVEYQHLKVNWKKKEAEKEKLKDIERINETIKNRVHYISTRKAIVETNHYTVKSLLDTHQRKESERIYKENVGLVKRLQNQKSPYDRFQAERDYQQAMYYARNRSAYGPATRYRRQLKPRKLEPLTDTHEMAHEISDGMTHEEENLQIDHNDTQTSARWASAVSRNPAPPPPKPAATRKSPRTIKIENDAHGPSHSEQKDDEQSDESEQDPEAQTEEEKDDDVTESSSHADTISNHDENPRPQEMGAKEDASEGESANEESESEDEESDTEEPNDIGQTLLEDNLSQLEDKKRDKSEAEESQESEESEGEPEPSKNDDGDVADAAVNDPSMNASNPLESDGDEDNSTHEQITTDDPATGNQEEEFEEEEENLALTRTSEQHIQTLSPDEMNEMMGGHTRKESTSSETPSHEVPASRQSGVDKLENITENPGEVDTDANEEILEQDDQGLATNADQNVDEDGDANPDFNDPADVDFNTNEKVNENGEEDENGDENENEDENGDGSAYKEDGPSILNPDASTNQDVDEVDHGNADEKDEDRVIEGVTEDPYKEEDVKSTEDNANDADQNPSEDKEEDVDENETSPVEAKGDSDAEQAYNTALGARDEASEDEQVGDPDPGVPVDGNVFNSSPDHGEGNDAIDESVAEESNSQAPAED